MKTPVFIAHGHFCTEILFRFDWLATAKRGQNVEQKSVGE
jgi:hypothetical protein